MTLTTPPNALLPYSSDAGPRTTSMRSLAPIGVDIIIGEVTGLVRKSVHSPPPTHASPPRMKDVDVARIAKLVPHPLLPVQLELQEPVPEGFPDPLPPLELGEGPHLSYAIQWFGFCVVAVVGWGFVLRRRAHRPSPRPPVAE